LNENREKDFFSFSLNDRLTILWIQRLSKVKTTISFGIFLFWLYLFDFICFGFEPLNYIILQNL